MQRMFYKDPNEKAKKKKKVKPIYGDKDIVEIPKSDEDKDNEKEK